MKTVANSFLISILLIASIATAQQPCSQPPHTSVTNWAEFHFDSCLTGFNPNELILGPATVGNLRLKWSYATGAAVYSSPAVANGVVYVGSTDGNFYALDASTGAELWSFTVGSSIEDRVYSGPAVANGVVFVGSLHGDVYALNASTGAKLWSYRTSGSIVGSSPAVANGVVYIGSDDHNLYALDASTGARLWSVTTGAGMYSSPAVANGVVYVGSLDDNIYAFDLPHNSF